MQQFIKSYWIHVIAGLASVLTLTLAIVLLFVSFSQQDDHPNSLDEWLQGDELAEEPEEGENTVAPNIMVDVKGSVMSPGIYELAPQSRVVDAIHAAGGLSEEGDANQLNFAMILQDEMQIYAPAVGEELSATPTQSVVTASNGQENQADGPLVNINTALETELETLNGVGPSKSASIIAYREEHGPFATIEDLMNVSGIGEKSFEKLKSEITVQ
ncbi:helix-hairpin-helix domain-containing protein [Alkalicoccobacillus gibsonii]|uniref:Helix-hairpin-helix domain-containing protein n=1 Tax=Alkalicoccobacillus gibsonii TaxID=79881 RepID=A0ABU9VGN5_9BACI